MEMDQICLVADGDDVLYETREEPPCFAALAAAAQTLARLLVSSLEYEHVGQ